VNGGVAPTSFTLSPRNLQGRFIVRRFLYSVLLKILFHNCDKVALRTPAEKFSTYSLLRVRVYHGAWVWKVICFHRCEEFLMD